MATFIPAPWGGYDNGSIPEDALESNSGALMEPRAARQFALFKRDHDRATGLTMGVTASYRPYARQVEIFTSRYTRVSYETGIRWDGSYWIHTSGSMAAVPGTSNHGWAKAVDLNNYNYSWLNENSIPYGFDNELEPEEPWHWSFRYEPTITNEEDEELTPDQNAKLNAIYAALIGSTSDLAKVKVAVGEIAPRVATTADVTAAIHGKTVPTDSDLGKIKAAVGAMAVRVSNLHVAEFGHE